MRYLRKKLDQWLPPSGRLSRIERARGLAWWIRNGVGSQAMDTLTVGAFMTAFALELGASAIVIGMLAAIPHFSQIVQIAGVYIAQRWRNRRAVSVFFTALSRPMFLVMAATAFIDDQALALKLLLAAFTARYVLTALMSSSWNAWIRDLVPESRRGNLTGRRLALMSGLSIILGFAAAAFIDAWEGYSSAPLTNAYAALFTLAFLGGLYSTYCMARMPELISRVDETDIALLKKLRQPYSDGNYRRLLTFVATWNFAINLAAPFFMVHMLQRLQLELWLVMLLTLISQLVNLLVYRRWGDIADRMSNKSVLMVCAPMFVACIFAWTFTTFPESHTLTIPLLIVIHVLTGIATAGVTLAVGNIAIKLAPPGDATSYLAANSLAVALSGGIAPIVGGLLAHVFIQQELSLVLRWRSATSNLEFETLSISQWDFFFAIATIIGLIALGFLSRVKEMGEVNEALVLNEMYLQARRFVQNLSSIAGLQQAGDFHFGRSKPRRARRREPSQATTVDADKPGQDP